MPGMTAYFGILEVGKIKEGETVLVSVLLTITLAYLTICLTPTIYAGIENSSVVLATAASELQTIFGSLKSGIGVSVGMSFYVATVIIPPTIFMLLVNFGWLLAQLLLRKVGLISENPKEPEADFGMD